MKFFGVFLLSAFLVACGGGGSGGGSGDGSNGAIVNVAGEGGTVANPVTAALPVARISALSQVNRGQVLSFTGSEASGLAVTYEWTLVGQPFDSSPVTGVNGSFAQIARTIAGDYTVQLVVSNSQGSSAPVTVTTTVIDAGIAPARPIIEIEKPDLVSVATLDIKGQLLFPLSYQLVSAATKSFESVGDPAGGAILVTFNLRNLGGTTVTGTAICPIRWDNRGYWRNTFLDGTTQFCFINP